MYDAIKHIKHLSTVLTSVGFNSLIEILKANKKNITYLCASCKEALSLKPSVHCDKCLRWMHFPCVNITEIPPTKYWFSPLCNNLWFLILVPNYYWKQIIEIIVFFLLDGKKIKPLFVLNILLQIYVCFILFDVIVFMELIHECISYYLVSYRGKRMNFYSDYIRCDISFLLSESEL